MKSINHKQTISRGIKKVIIMPTYGTPSWIYRDKLWLPMTIDREMAGGHYEGESSFFERIRKAEDSARINVSQFADGDGLKEFFNSGIWLKYIDIKPKVIRHDYVVESKINKKKKRY